MTAECEQPIYLNQLTQWHKLCSDKASYLKKVVSGGEPITLSIVTRCREAFLQFNQGKHVFNTLKENPKTPFSVDDLTSLEKMATEINDLANCTKKNWMAILDWIPSQDANKIVE